MISREVFEKVAADFRTPVYVYEEQTLRDRLKTLGDAITWRPLEILFAVKANSNPRILQILKATGLGGVDAVSPGEIALALRAGFAPDVVLFTGNNSTDEDMDFAEECHVLLNIDSLSRLEKYGRKYPGRHVCVRINPDVGAGHHDHCITGGPESKFGIWYTEIAKIKDIAQRHGLTIIGVHQHIGSQILASAKFLEAMEAILKVAPAFPDLKFIDFGGGFGVPYRPGEKELDIQSLGQKMTQRFAEFCLQYGRQLLMVVEPGRYLVAEAGFLLVTVNTIKRNPDGHVFVGVDSGFNHLDRPARYGSYHHITNLSNPDGQKEVVTVVGNVCESGDKFAVDRPINEPREGDILVIHTAGAYGYAMSSNYLLRPRPAEVLVTADDKIQEIRKREVINLEWR